MSSKRTAHAAMVVAEDALRRVRNLESGEGLLTVTLMIVISLGYLYFVQYTMENNDSSNMINSLDIYRHPYLSVITVTLIVLGLSGMFGRSLQIVSSIAGFSFAVGHIFLVHKSIMKLVSLNPPRENFQTRDLIPLPIGVDQPRCLPCTNGSNTFNPAPHRPDNPILGIGDPDPLPPTGVDFLSDPSGVYTTSGIAYSMRMG